MTKPDSDLWKQNQQGGFGWYFVKAVDELNAREILNAELKEQALSLRTVTHSFEISSGTKFENEEHAEMFHQLKAQQWAIQFDTLHTYPFNSIE